MNLLVGGTFSNDKHRQKQSYLLASIAHVLPKWICMNGGYVSDLQKLDFSLFNKILWLGSIEYSEKLIKKIKSTKKSIKLIRSKKLKSKPSKKLISEMEFHGSDFAIGFLKGDYSYTFYELHKDGTYQCIGDLDALKKFVKKI